MRGIKKRCVTTTGVFLLAFGVAFAQNIRDRIHLYFGDWHAATARTIRGALVERDILTKGDGLNPTKKGAVLRYINSYVYGTLAPRCSTSRVQLNHQQEIYFVGTGRGVMATNAQSVVLSRNIAILVPANLQFSIRNTGSEPLGMYIINEPTPPGFRPNPSLLVRDENHLPITSTNGMWGHIVKTLFVTADGLGTLQSVLTVTLDPLTMGKPHPAPGEDTTSIEEVWTALNGTSIAWVGVELRRQTPGMAYLHIPDNVTQHSNINYSESSQVRFLYFAYYKPHPVRP